jgi:hypothetical protein
LTLSASDLRDAPLDGVLRLAAFLGIKTVWNLNDTDGQVRHQAVNAIMRWEKRYSKRANKAKA